MKKANIWHTALKPESGPHTLARQRSTYFQHVIHCGGCSLFSYPDTSVDSGCYQEKDLLQVSDLMKWSTFYSIYHHFFVPFSTGFCKSFCKCEYRLSIPHLNCLRLNVLQSSDCFRFWNMCHIHNEISWGWGPSLNMKFIRVSTAPYANRLSHFNIFSALVFWLKLLTWGQAWNFPLVISCQHSKSFRFWSILISWPGILNL
jgi:hypothetical protein